MVLHVIFRSLGWMKDREAEGKKEDDKKGAEDHTNAEGQTQDPSSLFGDKKALSSGVNAGVNKFTSENTAASMPEAEEGCKNTTSFDVVPSVPREASRSPREKKSISSQESAVATDVTALGTEPSHSPTSSKIRSIELATPPSEDLLLATFDNNDHFDIPEDLPVFIRTTPVPKQRSKSVASSSRCSRRCAYDDPSQASATAATNTTALASSIGLKHETIAQTFADIIQELNLPEEEEERNGDNAEVAPPTVRQKLDQAMNDQRVLITELQEVISRLETDARREEAENARLKRRLQSATRRRGATELKSLQKSKGQQRRRQRPSSTTKQSKVTKSKIPQQQPFMFPLSEITCTKQENSFEDDLTWLDVLPTPPTPRMDPSHGGYEC